MDLKILREVLPEFGPLYRPASPGPYPCVLILHGSEGGWAGWSHQTAVFFAAHGFVAYPHCYSSDGNAWNAGSILNVPLDTTVSALAALRKLSGTGKVGIYGGSRGAEHALLLASLMARDGVAGGPDAIAAHSAPDVICGAFDGKSFRDAGDPGWRPWDPAERAWTWRGSSDDLLPTMPIEVEHISAPIFLSHGLADDVWSAAMTQRLAARLARHNKPATVCLFDGEGHVFRSSAANDLNRRLLSFFVQALI